MELLGEGTPPVLTASILQMSTLPTLIKTQWSWIALQAQYFTSHTVAEAPFYIGGLGGFNLVAWKTKLQGDTVYLKANTQIFKKGMSTI